MFPNAGVNRGHFKNRPRQKQHDFTINRSIRSRTIRIVGSDGHDGVYNLHEALTIADTEGVDLIEIRQQGDESICKLMEVNKYAYEQKQKEKQKKKNSQASELHEVRLSPDISENDVNYRVKNASDWLKNGDKVKCTIQFKGRQIVHKDRGELVMLQFAEKLKEVGQLESFPKLEGKRMLCIIKPKKNIK